MSFINYLRNGDHLCNEKYLRKSYKEDDIKAMVPIHKFDGKITKEGVTKVDGAVWITSGMEIEKRKEIIEFWQGMHVKSTITAITGVLTLVGGAARAATTASIALMVLGIAIAVTGLALIILGLHRKSDAKFRLNSWKREPIDETAKIRRSLPNQPLRNIIPYVGKYIHQDELEKIFFKEVRDCINCLQQHIGRSQTELENSEFLIEFFDNNPFNHIENVFPERENQENFKATVAMTYRALKRTFN